MNPLTTEDVSLDDAALSSTAAAADVVAGAGRNRAQSVAFAGRRWFKTPVPDSSTLEAAIMGSLERRDTDDGAEEGRRKWFVKLQAIKESRPSLEEAVLSGTDSPKTKRSSIGQTEKQLSDASAESDLTSSAGGKRKWFKTMKAIQLRKPSLEEAVLSGTGAQNPKRSSLGSEQQLLIEPARSDTPTDEEHARSQSLGENDRRKWFVKLQKIQTQRRQSAMCEQPISASPATSSVLAPVSPPDPIPKAAQEEPAPSASSPVLSVAEIAASPRMLPAAPSGSPIPTVTVHARTDQVSPFYQPTVQRTSGTGVTEEQEKAFRLHNIVSELFYTEEVFVTDLETLVEVFMKPLLEAEYVSHCDITGIFANLEEVFTSSRKLFEVLGSSIEVALPADGRPFVLPNIGNIFAEYCDCEAFSRYAKNQELASKTIVRLEETNPAFRAFLELARANPVCKKLPLSGFLIKPIQRICKYPLLFGEMMKCMADGDPEKEPLATATKRIRLMLDSINEHISALQKIETLKSEITGGIGREDIDALFQRESVVRDAVLLVKGGNSSKTKEVSKMTVVLLDDTLVLAPRSSPRPKRGGGIICLELRSLFIVEPRVKDEVGTDGGGAKNSVEVTEIGSRRKFVLLCESYLDKLTWSSELHEQVGKSIQRQQLQSKESKEQV